MTDAPPIMVQSFILPWPPSTNRYWRHPNKGPLAGRHLISAEGRMYRITVAKLLAEQRFESFGNAVLGVKVELTPPDRRRRDVDNTQKALWDALCKAGLYDDDSQLDDIHLWRSGRVASPGHVQLTIWKIRDAETKLAA